MTNTSTFEVIDSITNEVIEYVLIDRGNDEYTSMPKSIYDEQLAAQSANKL